MPELNELDLQLKAEVDRLVEAASKVEIEPNSRITSILIVPLSELNVGEPQINTLVCAIDERLECVTIDNKRICYCVKNS